MTIRLDPELDAAVREVAAAQNLSKQQLMERAALEYVNRSRRIDRTIAIANRIVGDHEGLLDRLSR